MKNKTQCADKNKRFAYEWKWFPIQLSHTPSRDEYYRLEKEYNRLINKECLIIEKRSLIRGKE